jgi:hypothetical protein
MKRFFRIEKVLIHNDNMDLKGTKTRVKVFGKDILAFQIKTKINKLKTA